MIAIDPGTQGCGVAFFDYLDKSLKWAKYVKACAPGGPFAMAGTLYSLLAARSDRVVIEKQRVYPKDAYFKLNDLFDVHEMSATFQGMLHREVLFVFPHEWKGSIKKEQMLPRIQGRLTAEELKVVERPARSLEHNVFDAVGIGLHFLGRLDRKRVITR